MKILVTPTSLKADNNSKAIQRLKEFAEVKFNETGHRLNEDELIENLQGYDGIIAGMDPLNEKVFKACKDLKAISRYGVGYDAVDVNKANEYGIIATNTPGANANSVAEVAVSLMLDVSRNIVFYDKQLRSGKWPRTMSRSLFGKTLGIIGLGSIGKNVAKACQGLGMNVCAYSPHLDKEYCKQNNIEALSFDELLAKSDYISMHAALSEQTHHLINKETIAKMKDGVIIVNTSRGATMSEEDIYQGLVSGKIAGFGTDVFETEPCTESKLFELDNVVVTPHIGGNTNEASDNMLEMAVDNIIKVLSGEECKNIIKVK